MARRPKPPEWLTGGFWEATVWKAVGERLVAAECWFRHTYGDPRECEGDIQGCHFVNRRLVREALEVQIVACDLCEYGVLERRMTSDDEDYEEVECPACDGHGMPPEVKAELIMLAEWDPRNAVPGCKDEHHTRFDHKRVPILKVKAHRVPERVREFVADYGLEPQLERKVA